MWQRQRESDFRVVYVLQQRDRLLRSFHKNITSYCTFSCVIVKTYYLVEEVIDLLDGRVLLVEEKAQSHNYPLNLIKTTEINRQKNYDIV